MPSGAGCSICLDTKLRKQVGKATYLQLFTGDFLSFQSLPVALVDLAVTGADLIGRLYAKLPQSGSDRHMLCLVEIQNGVIHIQKQKLNHFSFS